VGRGMACFIAIEDSKMSRAHARVDASGDIVRVTDLGSSNGTYINEVAVGLESAELSLGYVARR